MKNIINNSHVKDMGRTLKNIGKLTKRFTSNKKTKSFGEEIKLPNYTNTFFGYYDKTAFNPSNEDLIIIHANNAKSYKKPDPNEKTDILLFDWKKKDVVSKLGETHSWNWQQGARAHWLNEKHYIYNVYNESIDTYNAVIGDIYSDYRELIPVPVQESHPFGLVFSISYETLNDIRPDYGYRNHKIKKSNYDNSLYLYDLNKKILKKLVSGESLLKEIIDNSKESNITKFKLNHVLISPNAKNVIYLVRYYINEIRITDLYCLNLSSNENRLLLHNLGVSHYAWINDELLLLTCNGRMGFGYYLLNVKTNKLEFIIKFGDGHPTILSEEYAYIDTYPDSYGIRHLYLLNLRTKKIEKEISSYIEPILYHGETRCDLHPSLSPTKRYIQLDSSNKGSRVVRIIDLENV